MAEARLGSVVITMASTLSGVSRRDRGDAGLQAALAVRNVFGAGARGGWQFLGGFSATNHAIKPL